MEKRKTQDSQYNIVREEQSWRMDVHNFKMYYQPTVIKKWGTGGRIDHQIHRMEKGPQIDPYIVNRSLKKRKGNTIKKQWCLQQMVLEQLDDMEKKKKKKRIEAQTHTLRKS